MPTATLIEHLLYVNTVPGALYRLPNLTLHKPYEKRYYYSSFTDEETEVIKILLTA